MVILMIIMDNLHTGGHSNRGTLLVHLLTHKKEIKPFRHWDDPINPDGQPHIPLQARTQE